MSDKDITTLIAENCSFTVSRDVLVKHSLYFSAALQSGMTESATGRFNFSGISSAQLDLFVRCAELNFDRWPDRRSCSSTTDEMLLAKYDCSVRSDLEEVLEMAGLADYLQIPILAETCVARLFSILNPLFDPGSIHVHNKHNCCVIQDFLILWTRLSQSYSRSINNALFEFAVRHPNCIVIPSSSISANPSLRPFILDLVTCILSSDLLCVSNETEVLQLVLEWIHSVVPCGNTEMDLCIVQSLLNCVRPGLLSIPGQKLLLDFWTKYYPQVKWQGHLDYNQFAIIAQNVLNGGPFAYLTNLSRPPNHLYHYPRISTSCLLSLIPNSKNGKLCLWLFNLHTGDYRTNDLSEVVLNQLSNNSSNSSDLSTRVFLCHPTMESDGNTVVLLCCDHDSGFLNGFIWCLATRQAQWLPSLSLFSDVSRGPCGRSSLYSSVPFRSYRLGVSTLADGLYVYYAAPTHSTVLLHTFRFDFDTWSWKTVAAVSLLSDITSTTTVIFTPVEQLSSISRDGWLYANVELVDRSNSRSLPIGRHNLHHTAHVRSLLYRFRPHGDSLQVEMLPLAPFLIRIYRLLALDGFRPPGSRASRQYLFAFGTCSRDERATQFCFDTTARRWIEWSTCNNPREPQAQCSRSQCETNLCPELLGFHGLVCASTFGYRQLSTLDDDTSSATSTISSDDTSTTIMGRDNNLVLVLAGRPDFRLNEKHRSLGIWFHRPTVITQPEQSVHQFEPYRPDLTLPNGIIPDLSLSDAPALVAYGNWDNLTRPSDLFHFLNRCPTGMTSVSSQADEIRSHSSSSPVFPCFRYPWNYTACDSD